MTVNKHHLNMKKIEIGANKLYTMFSPRWSRETDEEIREFSMHVSKKRTNPVCIYTYCWKIIYPHETQFNRTTIVRLVIKKRR